MKPLVTSRRQLIDLGALLLMNGFFYFMWGSLPVIALFSLGYVWNWAASQDLQNIFENRRYRYSTLRLVTNLQELFLKPFSTLPWWAQKIAGIFPAGLFWYVVIVLNSSEMPWWSTFLGSATFELVRVESYFFKSVPPPLPPEAEL